MSSEIGRKIRVSIFGESHGKAIGAVIDNLPSGERIDFEELLRFMKRRQGGNNPYSTPRKEADIPELISGVCDGVTTGAPLCLIITKFPVKVKVFSLEILTIFRRRHICAGTKTANKRQRTFITKLRSDCCD